MPPWGHVTTLERLEEFIKYLPTTFKTLCSEDRRVMNNEFPACMQLLREQIVDDQRIATEQEARIRELLCTIEARDARIAQQEKDINIFANRTVDEDAKQYAKETASLTVEEDANEYAKETASLKGLGAPFPSAGSRTTGSDNETKAYAQRSDV